MYYRAKRTGHIVTASEHHGIAKSERWEPVVVVPLDQWRHLAELAAAWNSGDCCAAIADDMAGIIAAVEVQHE